MWNLKIYIYTNGLIYEKDSQTQNKLSYQGEEWGEGIVRVWD